MKKIIFTGGSGRFGEVFKKLKNNKEQPKVQQQKSSLKWLWQNSKK